MSQASFMNWHLTKSEFTWFIKLFVTLLTKNNSYVNWHFMMSQCTWFIKLFVTLYTKKWFLRELTPHDVWVYLYQEIIYHTFHILSFVAIDVLVTSFIVKLSMGELEEIINLWILICLSSHESVTSHKSVLIWTLCHCALMFPLNSFKWSEVKSI